MNYHSIYRLKKKIENEKNFIHKKKRIWKPIKYGINNFFISNDGLVKNIKTNKLRKTNTDVDGYEKVLIGYKKKRKNFQIHRLLGIAFIENPKNKPVIDHIDRNKKNNNLNNLRWATISENAINRNNTTGNPMYGKKHNDETKQKISEKMKKPKKKYCCINCRREIGSIGNLKRHYKKCIEK